jgi:hypothetical protein
MRSLRRSRRQQPRSKLATWPAVACVLAMSWSLASGCSDAREQTQPPSRSTVEPEAPHARVGPDDEIPPRAEADGTALRKPVPQASGYADPGRTSEGAEQVRGAAEEAGARARNTDALSQLDYQASQSLSQRANEAFGYLGVRPFEAPGELQLEREPEAPTAESRPYATPEAPADRREDMNRFRDPDAAPALHEKKAVSELPSAGEHAELDRVGRPSGPRDEPLDPQALSPAARFERERRSLEHLTFQPASGYWANTYVPGDPVMRWLESRLEARDRAALQAFSSRPLLLEAAARQTPQPFDSPSSAAISVFLQADRRGLESEGRMLVQVGLQGARRHGGLRPAMNVGIVLDLRGTVSTESASAMRALLDAFLKAKDVGDRFSLTVAGRPGGTLVDADRFRHGPVSVAMLGLVEPARPGSAIEPSLGLEEAVRGALADLKRSDDPAAPLGSSLVLLVTGQPLGPHTEALAAMAHRSAVSGVPVSVVGIGDRVQLAEIERVTLAGQGNRRLMHSASEAERLVARELSALSRVIARALRLRIRLAPDVKLVEVVGAESLDAASAHRVREAEKSVDRRLARNLGIESDRGRDEEGIQIVIPTFHSGDAHAVLLDVVAGGPGPIADVTVRYKDLVYFRNSVARANLTLGRSVGPRGPLERNVVKNYLAVRLSDTLKQAGRALLAGRDDRALGLVRDFRALLESLQRELPGFHNDVDLANDTGMLGEYLALLETGVLRHEEPRLYLADSLQLSGYFKTIPRPASRSRDPRR